MMTKLLLLCSFILCLTLLSTNLRGQDDNGSQEAHLLSAPKVTIPKEAKKGGVSGKISVRVRIDEFGKPTEVADIKGPGAVCSQVVRSDVVAIRIAAKKAAMLGKYVPAKRNGVLEPSSLWITFDFVNANSKESKGATKEEMNYSAAEVPPPDYKGPVNLAETSADSNPKSIPKTLSGGVLNRKAASLPRPPYPPAARAVRVSGAVQMQVLIDENGEVFSAEAVSGHLLLRPAAKIAACMAKFLPTYLSGSPVKVSGIITCNFVP